MTKSFFYIFRSIAKKFSGYGLRAKYPVLNSLYKKLNRRLSPESMTVLGHKMFLDRDDSLELTLNGVYEPKETQLIMEIVKPGQVVVDIGANIGYYTLILARLVGEHGKVFAFEPDPASFQLLQRNTSSNGYKNVILESKAVSNKTGHVYLRLDRFYNLDHRITVESSTPKDVKVDAICLDDFFKDCQTPIDFIKLDVQGAEGLVLQGMRQLLVHSRSVKILTEFWPMGLSKFGSPASYLYELENLGFNFFDIGSSTNSGFAKRTSSDLLEAYPSTSTKYTNLLCIRDDIELVFKTPK